MREFTWSVGRLGRRSNQQLNIIRIIVVCSRRTCKSSANFKCIITLSFNNYFQFCNSHLVQLLFMYFMCILV